MAVEGFECYPNAEKKPSNLMRMPEDHRLKGSYHAGQMPASYAFTKGGTQKVTLGSLK